MMPNNAHHSDAPALRAGVPSRASALGAGVRKRWGSFNGARRMLKGSSGVLLTAFLLTACATYQPPGLPEDQTAVLSLAGSGRVLQRTEFWRVDGKAITTAQALMFSHATAPVVLAPGKHTIVIRLLSGLAQGYESIWLVAEPAKSYALPCKTEGYKFICWIEDKNTGKPVGGRTGSDDEPQE